MSMKIPMTPAGIEPATFRFVAQHLNHVLPRSPAIHWVPPSIPGSKAAGPAN